MFRFGRIALTLAIGFAASQPALAAGCRSLVSGEHRELTGTLEYVILAGPPKYEDVQKGDMPKPAYILQLAHPICIAGDMDGDPDRRFRTVQVIETKSTLRQLRHFVHQTVTLKLAVHWSTETSRHHEPLVGWVSAVQTAGPRRMRLTDEYGTAATTIRAFYAALDDGQRDVAMAMVVPERRSTSALSSTLLTRLDENASGRIRQFDIARNDANTYVVHFRDDLDSRVCDIKQIVTTTVRGDQYFIKNVRDLNRCSAPETDRSFAD